MSFVNGTLAKLPTMSPEELNALDFGVVKVDDTGTVEFYNTYESQLAGVAPEAGAARAGQRLSRSAPRPKRFRDPEPAAAPRRSSRGSGARM